MSGPAIDRAAGAYDGQWVAVAYPLASAITEATVWASRSDAPAATMPIAARATTVTTEDTTTLGTFLQGRMTYSPKLPSDRTPDRMSFR
jgi:hypothetical protein